MNYQKELILLIKTKFERIYFPVGKHEYLIKSELAPYRLAKLILIYIHKAHFESDRILFDWVSMISANQFQQYFRIMLNDIFDHNDDIIQLANELNLSEKTAEVLDGSGLCYTSDFRSEKETVININPIAQYVVYLAINAAADYHHSKQHLIIRCDRDHLLINEIEKRLTLYLNFSIDANLFLRGKIETIRPKKSFVQDVAQSLSELKFFQIYELE